MFARDHTFQQRIGYSPVMGACEHTNPFGYESVASPMIGKMAGARNRVGHFVFASPLWGKSRLREVRDRLHRVRVSLAASSSHSVNRPQAGEVVRAGTTARGYSTWGDSHEARLECGLPHTQPSVQWGLDRRRWWTKGVSPLAMSCSCSPSRSHHRKNDSPRRLGAKTGGRTLRNTKENGAEKVIRYLVCQQGCG